MKKMIIAAALFLSSSVAFSLTDGQAAILGIVIGSQIQRHSQQEQYQQPRSVYINPGYTQLPRQYSDPCMNMNSSIEASYCRGASQRFQDEVRRLERDAFSRGYNGN